MRYYLVFLFVFLTIGCFGRKQFSVRESHGNLRAMLHHISKQMDAGDMKAVRIRCEEILKKSDLKTLSEEEQIQLYLYEITALNKLQEYDAALVKTETLLKKYKDNVQKYPKLLSKIYYQKGYTASGLHNQKLEIDYTQKALAVMEKHPALFVTGEFIQTYNDLYYYQINYEDNKGMETTYRKYLDFFNKNRFSFHGKQFDYARRVLRKMEVTQALNENQPQRAKDILEIFLKEVSKPLHADDIDYLNSCYSNINTCYYFAEQYTNTIEFGWKYLAFARQTKSNWDIMLAYSKIGISYEQLGDYSQAIRYIDLSMHAFPFGEFNASLYALRVIKAKCLSGMKRHNEAIVLAEQTLEEIISHKLGKDTKIIDLDIDQINDLNSHYYINIFASAGLLFVEKYKYDRTEIDLLKAEKILRISSKMFNEFYLKDEYNPRLYNLQTKNTEGLLYIATEKYASNPTNLISILNLIEENASKHLYRNYLKKSRGDTKKAEHIRINIDSLGDLLSQIQQKISEKEQILKYYVLSNYVYQVSITNKEISLQCIGKTNEIKQILLDYLQQIKDIKPSHKQYAPNLIQTLLPRQLNEKIIVVSDNFLNYLPFEALYDSRSTKFMVEQYDFSYSYSLALWLLYRSGQRPIKHTSSVIFNPDYAKGLTYQGLAITPLPHSRIEVQEIGQLLDANVVNHKVRKQDVVNCLSSYRLYHFSMHAYLDEDNFNRSCLLFGEGDPLFFKELYQMHIPADMVVLGACNTGNGKLKNGEGVMSLSMGFSFAGSRSNVYSLWQVPDAETAELLGYFYKNLKKGHHKDEALAKAKKEFIRKNPMKSHPFFWAGFIVNGDTAPLFPVQYSWWIILLCIGTIILIGLMIRYSLRSS